MVFYNERNLLISKRCKLISLPDNVSLISGYGHIAPKTEWGRIFCISYAMLGIPLMLMFLANVGDVLAEVFKYIYAKVICCGCLKSKKKQKQMLQKKKDGGSEKTGKNLVCSKDAFINIHLKHSLVYGFICLPHPTKL